MKLPLITVLALSAVFIGSHTGQPPEYLTEYDAVHADGPYSYLPTPGFGIPEQFGKVEIVTEEEARMTDALLSIFAGDPMQPTQPATPLDGPALSDNALMVAGL